MLSPTSTSSTVMRAAGCALGSLLLLAACTTGNDNPGTQDSVGLSAKVSEPLPVLSDDDSIPPGVTGELVPGVYALLGKPSAEQQLVLDQALYLKVKKCMKDQGFTLHDPPPKLEEPKQPTILFDGYIGILDADYAKNYGYQLNMSSIPDTSGYRLGKNQTPKEYEFAFKVAGGGGCLDQAERAIEKDRPSEDDSTPLLGEIYQKSLKATYADEDYEQARASWASCMKSAGFDYDTPLEAFSAFDGFSVNAETMSQKASPQPPTDEIETAVADVECKRSSRLVDVFRHVFWNHQVDMAEKNRPTLKVLDQVTDQRLRNAKQIIKELG